MHSTDSDAAHRLALPLVVIDPGHGGFQQRGRSSPNRVTGPGGTAEKDIVLDLARRTASVLVGQGIPSLLTRDADMNRSLAERAAMAQAPGVAAFISIHMGGPGGPDTPVTCVHPQSARPSRGLAARVHQALSDALGAPGGQVIEAKLGVLEPTRHRPGLACCLVEPLMLSSESNERRLADLAFRERLAGALGRAVGDWVRAGPLLAHAGTRRAVVVGIDDYTALGQRLRFAGMDAVGLAGAIIANAGFDPSGVVLMRDRDASSTAILEALAHLGRQSREDDALALVFAGMGAKADPAPGALVAHDGVLLTSTLLASALVDSPLRSVQVVADAGFAADATVPGSRSVPAGSRSRLRTMGRGGRGAQAEVCWTCAAGPSQDAAEHEGAGHGLFTAALMNWMRPPTLDITNGRLTALLAPEITRLTLAHGVVLAQQPWTSAGHTRLLAPAGGPRAVPLPPLHHTVPLVAQRTGMSCWAAAAAMLVGWRDRLDVNGAEVAQGAGRWEAYREGLHPSDIHSLAQSWSLLIETRRNYGVGDLYALLKAHGPLWVGEADPDLHVVVVCGMKGDGTGDGTEVEVVDPWPVGQGERYTVSFRELMANLQAARELVGFEAQVLHTGGRTARATE